MLDVQSVERLRNIFRAAFDYENGRDVSDLRQADEPRWDSLMHVSLIAAIEGEFDVTIDVVDSLRVTSFRSAQDVLEEQLR